MDITFKTSISLQKEIWEKLKKFTNRSGVINEALAFYFRREEMIKKAENAYWKKVEASLKGESDEYTSLNPKKEKVTEELLDEKLWN